MEGEGEGEGEGEEGDDEAPPKGKEEEQDGLPEDSPMFVPKGPYYHHDIRGGDTEEDKKEERFVYVMYIYNSHYEISVL